MYFYKKSMNGNMNYDIVKQDELQRRPYGEETKNENGIPLLPDAGWQPHSCPSW